MLALAALILFVVWGNSFIAVAYLLGSDGGTPRFDFIGLTVGRFLPASLLCGLYCLVFRRAESLRTIRLHWPRLLVCATLMVPGYNLALNFGMQHGVAAPVASLITTLVPLFVMLLAALFLGERITSRRLAGFALAMTGLMVISLAKKGGGGTTYPLVVGTLALAPFCWSIYSVVSKPLVGRVSPVVWTYLGTALGGLMILPALPLHVWPQWSVLDPAGWVALLYLSVPCTVLGFAVWTWLLRHLPASTVGFTVFLNPPLTTVSKLLLATLIPATFAFTVQPREWFGGAITMAGVAIAVLLPRRGASGVRTVRESVKT